MKTLISPSKSPETTTSPVRSFPAPGQYLFRLFNSKKVIFTFSRFLSPGHSLKQQIWNRSKERARDNGTVGLYCFVVIISVFPRRDGLKKQIRIVM